MSAEAAPKLHYFMCFSSTPPVQEGIDPTVYWYYTPENHSENYKLNEVGLIITFIRFAERFDANSQCDYIFTNTHEIAVAELCGHIWLAASIQSNSATNRSILHSILYYCRDMFSFFWCPLPSLSPKNPDDPIFSNIISHINDAFPLISSSIDWRYLDFTYLFNSFVMHPLQQGHTELETICRTFIDDHSSLFSHIAVFARRRRIVCSTFPPMVTRALAFGLRKRFSHLFLHKPKAEGPSLTWIIGLYVNSMGFLSAYQPQIFFDGKSFSLMAFKYHGFKIALAQPESTDVDETTFAKIPKMIKPLCEFLKRSYIPPPSTDVPIPFAMAMNLPDLQKLMFDCNQIDAKSRYTVDENIIMAHDVTIRFSKSAKIAYPGKDDFFVVCKNESSEQFVLAKTGAQSVSQSIKLCNFIIHSKAKQASGNESSCIVC